MTPTALLALITTYKYLILVPAALLWGLLVGMVVGVAIRLGFLDLIPAYACIMLGELIGDVIWYYIGYHWGESFTKRYGKFVGLDHERIDEAQMLFRKHDQRILFFSKISAGFGFAIPILFTAGMSKMPFTRYISANMLGQFIWSGGLIAVGYFFGDLYLKVNSVFEKITVASLAVIVFLLGLGFLRYLGKRVRKGVENAS